MNPEEFLAETERELRRLRTLAERAMAQVTDEQFFKTLDEGSNSIAVIAKHVAGNMRSRWRDFLTADGEKPDRRRDREFVIEAGDTRPGLLERWNEGWSLLFEAFEGLKPGDLERVVLIRGERHSVAQAITRQLTHYASHVGQIILLSKHFAGADWRTLSIPRGRSEEFNRNPKTYLKGI